MNKHSIYKYFIQNARLLIMNATNIRVQKEK